MRFDSLQGGINFAFDSLKYRGEKVDTGHWQGVSTKGKPDLVTKEFLNLQLEFPMPLSVTAAQDAIKPNLPWAEDHFQERVAGEPSNPGEEYMNWPWWHGQESYTNTVKDPPESRFKFTHTYQERFWPKQAGKGEDPLCRRCGAGAMPGYHKNYGIRYEYGDLDDVISLLGREPYTRQAYFPIFFPEDTGANHGGRIPCSLGYHFLLRGSLLHCWYEIRSCDAVRHFRDDLYLATRLVQWVLEELITGELNDDEPQLWNSVRPGIMHFSAHSFHVHMGDYHLLP
jgi:hypothetical protein